MSLSDFHPMLTVKNLLATLTAVATLTLGMFIFDAERVIGKQDAMDKTASDMQTAITVLAKTSESHDRRLDGIDGRLDVQGGKITDIDKRTSILETVANESAFNRGRRLDKEHLPR